MDTRERTEQKSRDVSRERAGHFTIKRRFYLSIIEELAVDNAEVEDLFRQILQRVEEELILDQFRNL